MIEKIMWLLPIVALVLIVDYLVDIDFITICIVAFISNMVGFIEGRQT